MENEKKEKTFAEKLAGAMFKFFAIIIGVVVVAYIAASVVKHKSLVFDLDVLTSGTFMTVAILGGLLALLYLLSKMMKTPSDSSNGAKIKTKGGM